MLAFAASIISPLAMLAALGAHTLPAAAQDAPSDFPRPHRLAQISASLGSASVVGSRPDMAQDEMLTSLKAESPAYAGHALILTGIPPQESGGLKTGSVSSLKREMQNESLSLERSGSLVQNLASRPEQGLRFPLLRQATIANALIDLKTTFGPESMKQSGNFHWFFESQRLVGTGNKSPSLVACSKMAKWASICASTNASNFGVYFSGS